MNKFISIALVSLIIIRPINATEIFPLMQISANPTEFIQNSVCPNGVFNEAEARSFIFRLKNEIKAQHGIDLDLHGVIEAAISTMRQSGKLSENEISIAREFYTRLITQEKICCSRKSKKNKKSAKKTTREQELVLPDRMAAGFMSIIGGAILCVLPFGVTQGIGGSLVVGGIALVVDGSLHGEKPYRVDTETGERIPINPPS